MSKKAVVGDVIKIPLGDGTHSYGLILSGASYAFYDSRTSDDLAIEQITKLPLLFVIAVMSSATKEGRWSKVGRVKDNDSLTIPPKFIQDPLRKESFSLYENSGEIRKATKEECLGLERAAVWDPEHVEDRLRDHYAGRVNKWVELLRIR
jgi:hypothetical protein